MVIYNQIVHQTIEKDNNYEKKRKIKEQWLLLFIEILQHFLSLLTINFSREEGPVHFKELYHILLSGHITSVKVYLNFLSVQSSSGL